MRPASLSITLALLLVSAAAGVTFAEGFTVTGYQLAAEPPPALTALRAAELAGESAATGVFEIDGEAFEVTAYQSVSGFDVVDFDDETTITASSGLFGINAPFSSVGVTGDSFAVSVSADLLFAEGVYSIGFGSDDGATLSLSGVVFETEFGEVGPISQAELTFNDPRSFGYTFGSFTVGPEGLATELSLAFFENDNVAGLEIYIAEGVIEQGFDAVEVRLLSASEFLIPEPTSVGLAWLAGVAAWWQPLSGRGRGC